MKIKFDIIYRQEIESGKYKVVTANNKPVKIERWDMKGNSPILASMMVSVCDYEGNNSWEEERAYCYGLNGTCSSMTPSDHKYQLFIDTGDDLTEAERMLYNKINDHVSNGDPINEEGVREWLENNFMPVLKKQTTNETNKTN